MKSQKFFWGASVASHQVEGNNVNQWTEWEKKSAVNSAKNAATNLEQLKNWKEIKSRAESPDNYISG